GGRGRERGGRSWSVDEGGGGVRAGEFGIAHSPSGRRRKVLAGSSPVLPLRVPQELKDEIQAEASRRDSNANDVILSALADGLGVPAQSNRKGRKLMASTNGSKNGSRAKDKGRVALIGVGNIANSPPPRGEDLKD